MQHSLRKYPREDGHRRPLLTPPSSSKREYNDTEPKQTNKLVKILIFVEINFSGKLVLRVRNIDKDLVSV